MNISISTYQVKSGDTLESVAEQLGISAEALKRYHNTYCDLKSLIEIDIKGVFEIMIPSPEKIKELQKKQQNTLQQAALPPHYLTKDFYALQYIVSERCITPSQDEDFTIDYKLGVQLKENTKEGFVAEVHCFNYEKVDDKISSLSIACMESIYPLTFSLPVQGKIKQLYEPKNLLKKFESKRSDLEDFFVGEVAELYLNKFHHILKNESYLTKQLTSTLLHQSLFPKTEWLRKTTPWEEEFCLYPSSFFIKMKMETVHNTEDTEFLETVLLGTSKEKYNLQELLRGIKFPEETEELLDAKLEIRYHTYKTSKKLYQVETVVRLWYEEEDLYYEHSVILAENKDALPKKKITTLVEE